MIVNDESNVAFIYPQPNALVAMIACARPLMLSCARVRSTHSAVIGSTLRTGHLELSAICLDALACCGVDYSGAPDVLMIRLSVSSFSSRLPRDDSKRKVWAIEAGYQVRGSVNPSCSLMSALTFCVAVAVSAIIWG